MGGKMPKARKTIYTIFVKRLLDIVLSSTAIIMLSPLFLILSVLELICHGRPVIFAQERPGLNGKIFKLYKFRSMTEERDDKGVLLPGEQRVTKFGRMLRKLSLDELPELFCILKGDMSIVGPRPLHIRNLPLYSKRHRARHKVRPGLACVPLKPMKTWTWNDQFENDIWYIENCSFLVDVKMMTAMAKEAIYGSDYRAGDTRREFNGRNLYEDAKKEGNT